MVLLAFSVLVASAVAACGNDEGAGTSAQDETSPSSASVPYRAIEGGKALVGPGDERIPIRSNAITGFVDNVIPEEGVINVTGWAAAGDQSAPAQRVVGVVGATGVGQARPTAERPDVVESYGAPAIEKSGFTLFVEMSALECSAPAGGLTVFGIVDGAAGPLALVGNSEQELDAAC